MAHHDDRNSRGRILRGTDRSGSSYCQDNIDLHTHQLGCKLREPRTVSLRVSVLGRDVLSFYVANLVQSQPNCLGTNGLTRWVEHREISYPVDFL